MKTDRKTKAGSGLDELKTQKSRRVGSKSAAKTNGKHPLASYEHIPVGIVECSPGGRYINVNEEFCRITGYEREELLQRGIKEMTHEDDCMYDINLHERLVAGKIPFYKIEKRMKKKDGEDVWVELTRSVVRDPNGQALYTVGSVLDISDRKHVERVLRESVERLRIATQAARMFMWEWDLQTQMYTVDDNFVKVLGFSGGLLPKARVESVWNLMLPEDSQAVSEALVEAIERHSDQLSLQSRMINPENGEIVWIEMNAKIVYDEDGNATRMFGVTQNITENKKAEAAIQLARTQAEQSAARMARLQAVTAALSQALTPQQVAEVLSKQGAPAFGAVSSSMMILSEDSQSLELMYSTSEESLVKPYRQFSISLNVPAADAARSGKPVWIESQKQYVERYPHLINEINRWGQQAAIAIPMIHKERISGVFTLSFDRILRHTPEDEDYGLTLARQGAQALERARAEEALRRSEANLRNFLENASVGIHWVDRNGIIKWTNQAELDMLGYAREEYIGRPIAEFHVDMPVIEDILRRLGQGESIDNYEARLRHKDGSIRYGIINSNVLWENGEFIHTRCFTRDITARKQAEEKLRESEERFRALVSQATAGIAESDMDSQLVFVNPRFCEMLGYSEEELLGKTVWELTYTRDLEENKRLFKEMVNQGKSYQFEKRFIRKDGSLLWTNVSVSTIRDLAGSPKGGVGVVLDIEERKRAEKELTESARQQEALYKFSDQLHRTESLTDIFDAALNAILNALQCDRASILLFDNEYVMRFVAWRGLSEDYRKATEGHSPWKPDARDPEPICLEDVRTADLSASLREVIQREGIGSLAFIPLLSNGKLIGKFMVYFNTPYRFSEGDVELSLTIAHQISFGIQRKQAEQALRQSEERYRVVVESQVEMLCRFQADGKILFVNGAYARARGTTPEALLNQNFWEFIPDEDRQAVRGRLNTLAPDALEVQIENRFETAEGERWILWTNRALKFDANGKFIEAQSSGIDITERKQTEKRVALLAEISELLRNVDDSRELMYSVSQVVGKHLRVKRVLFNEIDLEHDREIVYRDYHNGLESVAGIHKVSAYSSITSQEVSNGKTVVNVDSKIDPRTAQDYEKTYGLSGERAYVVVPMMRNNRWVASLWVSDDTPRNWSDEEVSLLETIAERTWTVIEKLRINAALRESEERLRATLATTTVGFATLATDTRFVDVNDAFCHIVGYSREELLGMDCAVLTHPNYIERTNNHVAQLLTGEISSFVIEKLYIRKDGAQIWVQNSVSIMRGADGKPLSLIVICQDVTERKRAEEALHESEYRFREMIDALPAAIYTTDAEGRITHFNPAAVEFSGRTPELGSDKWCVTWKLYYPDGSPMPHDECPMAITLKEGRVVRGVEAIAERPDGKRVWFEPYPTPLRDSEGRIVGGINMLVEITERKRAEESLRASESLYRAIARSIPGGGVYVVDKDFRYMVAEGPVTEAFGLTREVLEGRTVTEAFPDERGRRMEERLRRNLAGETVSFETSYNGRVYWTQQAPLQESIGQVIILTLDITERKRVEEALRQSEERFVRFMEHLPGLAWIKDLQGHYVYANAAAEQTFNTPRDKLYGITDEDIFPPDVAAQFKKNDEQALKEEKGVQVIETLRHGDGILHYSLVSKFPIPGPDGKTVLIGGTAFDITDRRQAEEALRESEERFRAILRQATAGVVHKGADGRLIFVNEAFCNMLGYAEADMIGKTVWDFMHPDDIEENRQSYNRLMEEGIPFKLERRFLRQDGSVIWVDASVSPIMHASGKPQSAVAVEVDITNRKLAEAALRDSEERFRAILRQATAGIVRKDPEGRMIFVNEAFCNMLGYTEPDLLGKTVWQFMHEDDVAVNRASFNRLMAEGVPFKLERRFIREDGSVIWVDASVSPIMDADGKPQSAVAVEVDITARKQAEEALHQLNLQLEDRVMSRTAKLRAVNQALRDEIMERHKAEEALRKSEAAARENEEKLSTLFELLPVGISFLDPQGQIIQMNPALANILKLSKNEALAQEYQFRKYIRANGTLMSPSEFASQRALIEGRTVYNVETGVILENSDVIWTSVSAAPVAVADVGAVVVTVDITENKRAERALQESRERLQILSQRLVEVQEEERRAIARELHDRVGQTLAALNINLIIISGQLSGKVDEQISTRLGDSMKLVAETISLVRDVMSNLRPSVLDDYGLEAALESHLSQYMARYQINAKFERPEKTLPRLVPSMEMTFLRIAQEALMNIARHARASQVKLALWQEENAICMTVEDNGIGIESWQNANRPGSHGLTIMRERAEAFGGSLKVSSVPGKGTRVELKIPVESVNPAQALKEKS